MHLLNDDMSERETDDVRKFIGIDIFDTKNHRSGTINRLKDKRASNHEMQQTAGLLHNLVASFRPDSIAASMCQSAQTARRSSMYVVLGRMNHRLAQTADELGNVEFSFDLSTSCRPSVEVVPHGLLLLARPVQQRSTPKPPISSIPNLTTVRVARCPIMYRTSFRTEVP